MPEVQFASSKRYWLLMTLGSLGMAAGGAIFLVIEGVLSLAGWGALLFFGGCATVGALQVAQRGPRLTISDQGVFDRTLKVGVIAWEDIEGATVRRLNNQPFVALELRDSSKYTSRLSPLLQRLVQANTALGFPPLSLNLTGLDADPSWFATLCSGRRSCVAASSSSPAAEQGVAGRRAARHCF